MSGDFINPPQQMCEYVCPKRILQVANMTLVQYKPIAESSRKRLFKDDPKGSFNHMKRWALKHAAARSHEAVNFTYRFPNGKCFGRMGSDSIAGIARDIRGFVCIDEDTRMATMTDLDMNNCHPTILLHESLRHGFTCTALTDFVTNRKGHIEALMDSTCESYEECKSMFLETMNSHVQSCRSNLTPFFVRFDRECKDLQRAFLQLNEYRFLLPHAEKKAAENLEEKQAERRKSRKTTNGLTANLPGSFVNLVLCLWENRFLGVACKRLIELGYEICCNNYDGMMIRGHHYPEGEDRTVRDDVICPVLEEALKETFGIAMGWSMKRHCSSVIYEDGDLRLPYPRRAEYWLSKIFRVGSQYYVQLADGTIEIEKGVQLAERLKGETAKCILDFPGKKSWYSNTFAETLCKDPEMREFDKADMYPNPSECPERVYNLWTPMLCEEWDVTQADPNSEHVLWFRHFVMVLASHNREMATFIELFIAHMLKFPWLKPLAYLVLMSEEGAGKGTLVAIINRLLGDSKVKEVSNVRRSLLGTFNRVLLDAFFLVLDEAKGEDLYAGSEEFKNLITGPTVLVNAKNLNEMNVRSYARVMITVQPRLLPTKRGDRRQVVSRCSDELIGNQEFWNDAYKRMSTPEFMPDIHAYLVSLEPPSVFMPHMLPKTEAQTEIQRANADMFESWVHEVVEAWLGSDDEPTFTFPEKIPLRSYDGKRSASELFPEFSMTHMYSDFQEFVDRCWSRPDKYALRYQVLRRSQFY